MSKNIEVRIRHESETHAVPLTEWPMDDLEGLIRTIKMWGLADDNGIMYDGATFGQITVRDGAAYFEVIFGAGDES